MALPVVGLGAGGHAKVVIEILKEMKGWKLVGVLDPDTALHGGAILGVPVLGGDEELPRLKHEGVTHFFVGVGSVGDPGPRIRIYERSIAAGLKPAGAIHPGTIISPSAKLGEGVTVMAGALIGPDVVIGDNVIVNTGSVIEHDCEIGDHAHVATGARLAGGVVVGRAAHVGAGATILQRLKIAEGAILGAGAVIIRDVAPNSVVAGVPASEIRSRFDS